MTTQDLARQLIDVPSITGEEHDILLVIENILKSMELEVERQRISDRRWNLFAGWQGDETIAFCTHVDTVPPWYPARLENDDVFGRGACDTKGIIASMIIAGKRLIAQGHRPSYLFVVGEETDSIGAKTAAASGRRASAIVVGEPTDSHLASGHKGTLGYTLRTTGIATHSAYPERGRSAIHELLDIISDIKAEDWGSNDILGPATLNIGRIQGGIALNTFAPSAEAGLLHRIVDDAESRKLRVEQIVNGRADIEFHSISEPQFLETLPGFAVKSVNFGTDIPHLRPMGRCLLAGPGSVHDAHTDHEHISIKEMDNAVDMYVRLYEALRDQR